MQIEETKEPKISAKRGKTCLKNAPVNTIFCIISYMIPTRLTDYIF